MSTFYNPLFVPRSEHRYKIMRISPELLFNSLFSPTVRNRLIDAVEVVGLPEECEIVSMEWNSVSRVVELLLYSKEFPALEEGNAPLELSVACTRRIFDIVNEQKQLVREAEAGSQERSFKWIEEHELHLERIEKSFYDSYTGILGDSSLIVLPLAPLSLPDLPNPAITVEELILQSYGVPKIAGTFSEPDKETPVQPDVELLIPKELR